jgi:5'-3' exonuclease
MILLVDINYIMFRSMHASSAMTIDTNWADRPVNTGSAKLAFTTIMRVFQKLKKTYRFLKMSDLIFCDDWGRSFRKDLYEGYKKKRGSKERTEAENNALTDMFVMKNLILYTFEQLGCSTYAKKGYEADDIIGYFTALFKRTDTYSTIVSGDSDLSQLITKYVSLLRFEGKELVTYTPNNMDYVCLIGKKKEPWGCKNRADVVLYKATVGDSSDEYPGIPRFGDAKWLDMRAFMASSGLSSGYALMKTDDFFNKYGESGKKGQRILNMYLKNKKMFELCKDLAIIRRTLLPERRVPFYRSAASNGNDDLLAIKSTEPCFQKAIDALESYKMRDAISTLESLKSMGVL